MTESSSWIIHCSAFMTAGAPLQILSLWEDCADIKVRLRDYSSRVLCVFIDLRLPYVTGVTFWSLPCAFWEAYILCASTWMLHVYKMTSLQIAQLQQLSLQQTRAHVRDHCMTKLLSAWLQSNIFFLPCQILSVIYAASHKTLQPVFSAVCPQSRTSSAKNEIRFSLILKCSFIIIIIIINLFIWANFTTNWVKSICCRQIKLYHHGSRPDREDVASQGASVHVRTQFICRAGSLKACLSVPDKWLCVKYLH